MEQRLKTIEISLIKPSLYTPRKSCTEEELIRLAKSIKQNGLLQPIVVREEILNGNLKNADGVLHKSKNDEKAEENENFFISAKNFRTVKNIKSTKNTKSTKGFKSGKYILISGAKRLSALKILGIKKITCIVQNQSGLNAAVLCLIENMERSEINFFEEAEALKKIIQNFNLSEQKLSELLNISESEVHLKLKLLNFELFERELITKNKISQKSANALLSLNEKERKETLFYIIDNDIPDCNIENLCLNVLNENLKYSDCSENYRKDYSEHINNINNTINTVKNSHLSFNEKILNSEQKKSVPIKKMAVGNSKLFSNSFFNMIESLRSKGLNARTATTETDEFIEYTVRIFKNAN